MNQKSLTSGKIAGLCDVSYRSVLKWIEEGKLKAYQTPGGHNRVNVQDLINFLKRYNMPVPDQLRGSKEKSRILIVDDDKNMVKSIRRALRVTKKFEIETAFNGFDAGRKIYEFRPDLVILDIRMPGMDGYEVTKQIKQEEFGENIRIIAISAFFESEGKGKIRKLGADICIDKPFDNQRLLEAIDELVG